ncbi:deoxyribodipyrimidine photo-lyase [Brevundimonas sp.]|uniref:deoxyribodipyrimidine photo-lyase n=1 Tax=Brevundimonas sp. TaxID=1871086 RepID=UPI00289FA1F4|nr:deoxyribodipyrimidine photo-lyase [Brevundimonas sp.]
MANKPVILWFRRDLRLHDNPALNHAVETGRHIMPVFILDDHYDRPSARHRNGGWTSLCGPWTPR